MIKILLMPVFLLASVSGAFIWQNAGLPGSDIYPNELPGFKLFRDAPWSMIRPFETTSEDVHKILGNSDFDYTWNSLDWHVWISYVGEKSSCGDKPWPASLKGKVSSITLLPKSRVDFSKKTFPKEFKKVFAFSAHAAALWYAYEDSSGLVYEVYRENSSDGKIHEGDLRAISYGPSRKTYKEKTGCD